MNQVKQPPRLMRDVLKIELDENYGLDSPAIQQVLRKQPYNV